MLWLISALVGAAGAALQYGWGGPRRLPATPLPAALRAAALTLVMALLLDAPVGMSRVIPPWVALDASASMAAAGGGAAWRVAVDSARAARGDSLFLFGDSLRAAPVPTVPADRHSDVQPVVDRALATGRPVVVVTDGVLPGAAALRALPAGSRVVVIGHAAVRDAAALSLDAPRAVVGGDTIEPRLTIAAGSAGAAAGAATLFLGTRVLAVLRFDALAPFAERALEFRVRVDAPEGPAVLRAVVASSGDSEPRNDSLGVGIDVSRQPGAVFVSTSPDYDARYALAVLRGAVALPTRGFYHVSPGNWVVDGTYQKVTDANVRAAFRDAPVAILQGDTAIFGPPRQATRAPLALIVPTVGDGNEWYVSGAPVSPLSPALGGLPWDSLPPLLVGGGAEPRGAWRGLEARRGREAFTRTIIAGDDAPRRVVVVAASDLWRWEFRGGRSADAYTALWGSIFDYLASQRADRRAAVPDARLVRAGDPIVWRRGAAGDSVVIVALTPRGGGRADTLHLRFAATSSTTTSGPLPEGTYDAAVVGGTATLVVNAPAELVPRPPRMASGTVGGAVVRGGPPPARDAGWPYVLLVLLLCAEWVLRRRAGLR
ncbi:MAG TPA: hypothetical protein VNE60_12485 [Gemmatimonadaceae bacterium]|nr:hypothetical protein [Gemmatimonadaceae bacterium]